VVQVVAVEEIQNSTAGILTKEITETLEAHQVLAMEEEAAEEALLA
jgi:hypothetical protein